MLALAVMMMAPILGWGQVQTYQLITSDSQLEAGAKYLVVGIKATSTPETFYAMGLQNTNNRASVSITVASGEIVVEPATLPTDEMPFEVTLGGSSGVWTIFDAVNSTYLRPRGGANNGLQGQPTSTNANWSIAIGAGGLASMVCENTTTYPRNVLRFNASNNPPLFACYASGQADVYLYRLTPSSSSSIFLSPTDLSGFNYVQGSGPSAEQTFTVSGSDLTADISIAASTNYEISKTSGSGYTTPLTFTPAEAATPQTVYVRLKAGLSVGDYDNEVITAASTGATDKTVTVSGTVTPPPDAEPTNHASNFAVATGSPTFSAIDVVWDDATGGVIPAAYLIKGSSVSYAAIVAPVDGIPEADATLVKNIAAGIETATFTGLSENTTYYFKIFPYTNSGAAIDYKTNGIVPQDEATTEYGIPAVPVATAATAVTATGFAANWNAVAGATGYELDVYTKITGGTATETESFDGITPNGNLIGSATYLPGWSVLSQSTSRQIYTTSGNFGESSPSLAFTTSGDFIETATYANPITSLSFWAKQQGGATSSTLIEGYNGSSWSTIATLSNEYVATAGTVSYDLVALGKTDIVKIRLIYTKVAGNLSIDDVAVTYGGSTNTPITGSPFTITGDNSKAITGLASGTTYYYVVRATNSAGTSGNSNEIEVTTLTPPATSTFSGAGNWTNATNWSNGLPTGTTDVIINGNVTVDDVVECKNMTISSTGAVTVGAGISNGLIVNGNFLIESNATGTGSFIGAAADYTITGTKTIQRYLTGGWDGWDAGWHQLSSPVAAQPIADFATTGSGNDYDFYGWDEPTDTWMNYKAAGFSTWNGGTNFNVGQGYLVSYEAANSTQTFTGVLNTDGVLIENMSYGNNGWHLLGNPYASALVWNDDNDNWVLTNVAGTAKIWHEANKSYSDIAANGIIPSAQGFMVQVNNSSNSLLFLETARTHSATPFYKAGTEQLLLVAAETEGGSAQESKIMVNPMATEGFDFDYDSRFLAGYAPQLYSVVGDELLSTNSLPELASGKVIPLGFVKNAATAFTIQLKESIPGAVVYLTDNQTGIVTNLTETPVYSFTSDEGDDANRFSLAFGTVGISHPEATAGVQVFAHDGVLYVETPSKEVAQFSVYNLTGQLVLQGRTRGNALSTFNASALNTGVYVVNVLLTDGVVSRKVVINK